MNFKKKFHLISLYTEIKNIAFFFMESKILKKYLKIYLFSYIY